jgi:hypothetical protein
VHCCRDLSPGGDLFIGPDPRTIATAGGIFGNDSCLTDDKCAWDTCSLFVVLYDHLLAVCV